MNQQQRDQLAYYLKSIGYVEPKSEELLNLFTTWLNDGQYYIAGGPSVPDDPGESAG